MGGRIEETCDYDVNWVLVISYDRCCVRAGDVFGRRLKQVEMGEALVTARNGLTLVQCINVYCVSGYGLF